MKIGRILAISAAVLVVAGAAAFTWWRTNGIEAMAEAGAVHLDGSLERLRADFNAHKDKVRLLFIVGPSCGGCLRGLDDVNRELVGRIQADKRFHTFVVHVPALMATAADVPEAMKLMLGPNVSHYWDGDARSAFAYGGVLDIYEDAKKGDAIFAWDVWLAYAPGQTWDDDSKPPAPTFWRHQLYKGRAGYELDPPVFGADAMKLAGVR